MSKDLDEEAKVGAEGWIIHCLLLDGKGGAMPLDPKGLEEWSPGQGVLWLHMDYEREETSNWLARKSGLDPLICEALAAEDTQPRFLTEDNGMLLILRGVNLNPGSDPEDMVSIRMWIESRRILTLRHRKLKSIEDIKGSLQGGRGPRTPGEFLTMLTERLTERVGEVVAEVGDSVDDLEDSLPGGEIHELRARLIALKRQIISLRRHINPQRDVLGRLRHVWTEWLGDKERVFMREMAELTARYVEDLNSSRDSAAITQEELNSRMSERMNKTMYLLSIVAAVFLPLGLVTGLLGINVGGIPWAESGWAFWAVCLVLLLIAVMELLVFRFKRWL